MRMQACVHGVIRAAAPLLPPCRQVAIENSQHRVISGTYRTSLREGIASAVTSPTPNFNSRL